MGQPSSSTTPSATRSWLSTVVRPWKPRNVLLPRDSGLRTWPREPSCGGGRSAPMATRPPAVRHEPSAPVGAPPPRARPPSQRSARYRSSAASPRRAGCSASRAPTPTSWCRAVSCRRFVSAGAGWCPDRQWSSFLKQELDPHRGNSVGFPVLSRWATGGVRPSRSSAQSDPLLIVELSPSEPLAVEPWSGEPGPCGALRTRWYSRRGSHLPPVSGARRNPGQLGSGSCGPWTNDT